MFVAFGIRHAMRMRRVAICGLSGCTVLFYIVSKEIRFFFKKKAISITYCECMFVAFGIQHAMRKRRVAICGLSGCTVLFYIVLKEIRFFF